MKHSYSDTTAAEHRSRAEVLCLMASGLSGKQQNEKSRLQLEAALHFKCAELMQQGAGLA